VVAAFPLRCGSVACLQLHDEQGLRRGGVYLCAADDPLHPARAPRFDELFAEAAQRARAAPERRDELLAVLEAAHHAAREARPRLDPAGLAAIEAVLARAAELGGPAAGGLETEELVACCLLIFVSEEERYPRPRYRGGDVAWERLVDAVGRRPPGGPVAVPEGDC